MLLPGNMWREVWDTSIPVPACRQKCLFDDTKESEKVLHFFESCKNLEDVFCLLLPTLVHAALYTIINNETVAILRQYSPPLDEKLTALIQKAVGATRNINTDVSHFKVSKSRVFVQPKDLDFPNIIFSAGGIRRPERNRGNCHVV
jgi:Rab3 GTPase-activating protein catalytic subunit